MASIVSTGVATKNQVQAASVIPSYHDRISSYYTSNFNGKFDYASELAVSPDGTKLYVSDYSGRIQIFNTADNSFIKEFGSIELFGGHRDLSKLAISPNGQTLYVGECQSGGALRAYDIATETLVRTMSNKECAIPAPSRDGSTLYVYGTRGSWSEDSEIDVVNATNGAAIRTITLENCQVRDMITATDANLIYTVCSNDYTVKSFAVSNGNSTGFSVQLGSPVGVALSQDDSKLYVSNQTNREIVIINTINATTIDTMEMPGGTSVYGDPIAESSPGKIVVASGTQRAYVIADDLSNVQVFNTGTYQHVGEIGEFGEILSSPNGNADGQFDQPGGVVISKDGSKLYVADSSNYRIQVFNTSDNSLNTIFGSSGSNASNEEFDNPPKRLVISPDGSKLYITEDNKPYFHIYDTATNTHLATIGSSGSGPLQFGTINDIAFSTDGSKIYIADLSQDRVQILNASNNSFNSQFTVLDDSNQAILVASLAVGANNRLFASGSDMKVHVINTTNNTEVATFSTPEYQDEYGPMGDFAVSLRIHPQSSVLYTVSYYSSTINAISTSDYSILGSFELQGADEDGHDMPSDIAISPNNTQMYVANIGGHTVEEFRFEDDEEENPGPTPGATNSANLTNPMTNKPVQLVTPNSTNITCSNTVKEVALAKEDSDYQYPVGLVNFCFDTEEEDNEVSLTFVTDLKPNQVTVRKYHTTDSTYFNIEGATVSQTTHGGQAALKVTYTITDNGDLDLDGQVGKIKDPVGIAITNELAGKLGETGINTNIIQLLTVVLLIGSVAAVVYQKRRGSIAR